MFSYIKLSKLMFVQIQFWAHFYECLKFKVYHTSAFFNLSFDVEPFAAILSAHRTHGRS